MIRKTFPYWMGTKDSADPLEGEPMASPLERASVYFFGHSQQEAAEHLIEQAREETRLTDAQINAYVAVIMAIPGEFGWMQGYIDETTEQPGCMLHIELFEGIAFGAHIGRGMGDKK